MHVKTKMLDKVIAIFMCILLLSNLSLNIVLATSSDYTKVGYINFKKVNGYAPEVKLQRNKMTATYNNFTGNAKPDIQIVPTETAIYTITLDGGAGELEYYLYAVDSFGNWEDTRLAARYGNQQYTILTSKPAGDSTTIDVILEEGKTYNFTLKNNVNTYVTVALEKRNIQKLAMAATNIPALVVSAKGDPEDAIALENYNDPKIKLVEYSDSEIRKYIDKGVATDGEIEDGGPVEGILTDLILALGTIFVTIVEWAVNSNVPLTIDNILFNRFDQTVIDLTPLGGIQVGSATGKGIFGEISSTIGLLFNALKLLAFAIYIVMLLYIGLKILVSIGTKDQKKYMKYIEYWLTGLAILAFLPYFLPAIPAASNALIDLMEKNAKSLNGDYSTSEVLAKLGEDYALMGEDAEVVELNKLIDEKIAMLNDKLSGTPKTRDEAQANIDSNIAAAVSRFHDLTPAQHEELINRINAVKNIVDNNFDTWNDVTQSEYEEAIGNVREYIFSNANTTVLVDDVITQLPGNVKNNSTIVYRIKLIMRAVQRNAPNWSTGQRTYNVQLNNLESAMSRSGYTSQDIANCRSVINNAKNEYIAYAQSGPLKNLENLFEQYKMAVIQEEIEELKALKNKVTNDVMTTLKTQAQSQNRVVYAIAWAILLFQMFAILFMYYRRLFAITVLIIIFPLVMAFYVIDKSGDGKSQSLQKWLKEFLANVLVQVLHAAIYLILINIGIDACNMNPEKNWFFLILAVCFLFPGERILRSILGLEASTVDGLRNNVMGVVLGGFAVAKVARNTYRGTKSFVKNGGVKGAIEKQRNEFRNAEKKREETKKKRRSDLEASKEKARRYRQEYRDERQKNILAGNASKMDVLHERASQMKDAIGAMGVVTAGKAAIDAGKNMASKVKSNKYIKGASKAYRAGKFALKKGTKVARKGVGMTMGALEGMESFGSSGGGVMTGAFSAISTAKAYGGFENKPKVSSSSNKAEQTNPSRFSTVYNQGQRVIGTKRITPGNVNTSGTTSAANTARAASQIRSKLNVNTNIQTNNNGNP